MAAQVPAQLAPWLLLSDDCLVLIVSKLEMRYFATCATACKAMCEAVSSVLRQQQHLGEQRWVRHDALAAPGYAAVLPGGAVCVTDTSNNNIYVVATDGTNPRVLSLLRAGLGPQAEVWHPRGLAVVPPGADQEPFVCVASNAMSQLEMVSLNYDAYTIERRVLRTPAEAGEHPMAGMLSPEGVTYCATTRLLFVSDQQQHTVTAWRVCDEHPRHLTVAWRVGGYGRTPGRLAFPAGLAVLRGAELICCDSDNDRLSIFSVHEEADGGERFKLTIGRKSGVPGCFRDPRGVAVLRDALLVVAERARVQVGAALARVLHAIHWPSAALLVSRCRCSRQTVSLFKCICRNRHSALFGVFVATMSSVTWSTTAEGNYAPFAWSKPRKAVYGRYRHRPQLRARSRRPSLCKRCSTSAGWQGSPNRCGV
jgi:hypothetical protein